MKTKYQHFGTLHSDGGVMSLASQSDLRHDLERASDKQSPDSRTAILLAMKIGM